MEELHNIIEASASRIYREWAGANRAARTGALHWGERVAYAGMVQYIETRAYQVEVWTLRGAAV